MAATSSSRRSRTRVPTVSIWAMEIVSPEGSWYSFASRVTISCAGTSETSDVLSNISRPSCIAFRSIRSSR